MCGIFAVFGYLGDIETFRPKAVALSKRYRGCLFIHILIYKIIYSMLCRIRHRGPDWSGIRVERNNVLCHERLAIVGVDSGAQPLTNGDDTVILCVNGEIYNHKGKIISS
jgi:asparagine synthase (glutamine-hydrolysing)